MMVKYEKLVRDRIPEIIAANGEKPVTRILDDTEYRRCLEQRGGQGRLGDGLEFLGRRDWTYIGTRTAVH